ncbi:hypothetical protein [Paenibacillus mendelii]|uniref:Uncharacterized protein n=1 Tax=Paenibacillus mendelii TaxID=206163 RepID=A0ABV6JEP0_9BACL|nr:hypothetical protein [Paenibacillus mendelii]MCQ6557257.1 hypothetical protein [Paenibacillus mendelii]
MRNPFLILVLALYIASIIANWNKHGCGARKVIYFCTACLTIGLIVLYIIPFKFSIIEQTFVLDIMKATMNFMKG